jgi:DNA-binding MurR/RpiR family transcriptional regulator
VTETALVDDRASIAEHVRASTGRLTARERKAAQALLMNYPAAGLAPVAEFAERAGVSAPTVLRFVAKLGFLGYPDFQRQLREELEAQLASPLAKPAQSPAAQPPTPVHRSVRRSGRRQSARHVPESSRGRFFGDCRPAVRPAAQRASDWRPFHRRPGSLSRRAPQPCAARRPARSLRHRRLARRLLDIKRRDALVVFDIRRYQEDVVAFARDAAARGAKIVLVTDQWISPLSRQAKHVLACRVAAPSRWDSSVVLLAVVEALTAAATDRLGEFARKRIEELERLR